MHSTKNAHLISANRSERSAQIYRWKIPMDAGIVLRKQRLKIREGLLLCLRQGEREGWGEISPLPGFSIESLKEAQIEVIAWVLRWLNGNDVVLPLLPAVAFGISCGLAELNGSLPDVADYRVVPLCSGDPVKLFPILQQIQGGKIAKVKVGLWEVVRDGMLVNMLLEAIPDLNLRLDANRAWTLLKAKQFAEYINPNYRSRIAFLEEPCQTQEDSCIFARETGIPIAWDESLRAKNFILSAEPGVRAVVIKPTLIGSLQKVRTQVAVAHALGLTVVISSSIESSLGLTHLARIARWLTPKTIPGLDTLNLMQAQLVRRWPYSELPLITPDTLDSLL